MNSGLFLKQQLTNKFPHNTTFWKTRVSNLKKFSFFNITCIKFNAEKRAIPQPVPKNYYSPQTSTLSNLSIGTYNASKMLNNRQHQIAGKLVRTHANGPGAIISKEKELKIITKLKKNNKKSLITIIKPI